MALYASLARLPWRAFLLTALCGQVTAAVPERAADRLQALTRLPQVAFTSGLNFDSARGYALVLAEGGQMREVEEIQKALAGNASDAPRYARLAVLLDELGERALAAQTLARATELYRQQGAAESQDPALLVGYATVLQAARQRDEAGRVLRRAVEAVPTDSRVHAALARVLANQSLQAIVPQDGQGHELPLLARMMGDPSAAGPVAAGTETARRLMTEAQSAAERAVALAPREPGPLLARSAVRASQRFLDAVLAGPGNAGDGVLKLNQAIFHPDALPDLRAAARLTPNDPQAWGTVAMMEVMAEGFQRGLRGPDELLTRELWPTLPERTQAAVREALTRLEAIGQSADPHLASAALGVLGTLQFFVVRDTSGGAASLRRAATLDAANGNAWETLTFALAFSRQFAPMIEVCQERLKQRDTVRNRVLLAKAYERNSRLDDMLTQASAAQRRYPENLLANLTLGAALLKAARSESGRARALQAIARATQLAGENPPADLATELLLQRGLYFALSDQHAVARAQFRRLLELVPGHPEATEALQALEQTGD
jgi:tetratricopeptide (TPR) repeat protein